MVPGLKAVTLRSVKAAAHNAGRTVQKPRKMRERDQGESWKCPVKLPG
jgi:hypothetical protein